MEPKWFGFGEKMQTTHCEEQVALEQGYY